MKGDSAPRTEIPDHMSRTSPDNLDPASLDVLVPAGGRIAGEFAAAAGTEVKALAEVGGETLLARTLAGLRAAPCVRRLVVIGPEEALAEARRCGAEITVAEGSTGPDNIFRGLEALGPYVEHVLIATSDLPFLGPSAVADFLTRCPADADLCVAIVRQEVFAEKYPGLIDTSSALSDGKFRLGSIFRARVPVLRQIRPRFDRLFAARKSDLQLARLVGGAILLRYASRRLATRHIVARAAAVLGCRGALIHSPFPEIAFDIDLPEELLFARQLASSTPRKMDS